MSKRTCMETALAKLNYRMRTEEELRRSLKDLDYDKEDIDKTLEELISYGYVDDDRYVREFYRISRRKRWSRNRILRALKEKGISSVRAVNVLDDLEASGEMEDLGLSFDERETALELGIDMAQSQLRSGKEIDDNFLKKVGRRLTSLGYDTGCCFYVMNRLRDRAKDLSEEDEE